MEARKTSEKKWEYNLPLFKKFNFDSLNLGTLRILIAVYFLVFIWWSFVCTIAIIDGFNSIFFNSSEVFKILFFFVLGIIGSYLIYWGIVKIILWVKEGYKKQND